MIVASLSRARALKAAAMISFILGVEAVFVTLPELVRGVNAVSIDGNVPPYFVMFAALLFGILRIVGSIGTWQGQRGGIILTVLANTLDMMAAAPGILVAPSLIWRMAALSGVLFSATVVVLCFRRNATAID